MSAPQMDLDFRPADRPLVLEALDRAFAEIPVGGTLTAESLRDRLSFTARESLQPTTRKNLLGGWFQQLAKAHRIEADGFTTAQRDDARGRALRRWRKIAA